VPKTNTSLGIYPAANVIGTPMDKGADKPSYYVFRDPCGRQNSRDATHKLRLSIAYAVVATRYLTKRVASHEMPPLTKR
jgi:hypothetical protein